MVYILPYFFSVVITLKITVPALRQLGHLFLFIRLAVLFHLHNKNHLDYEYYNRNVLKHRGKSANGD